MSWIKRLLGGKPATPPEKPKHRPDADDPFDRPFYFVPFPGLSTPHADLVLVGTKCYMSDSIYNDLSGRHGRWVPSNKNGEISNFFTHTDIGQLDFALNDYINFLIRVRSIFESDLPDADKIEMIRTITQLTGAEGHDHAAFVNAHGGINRFLGKLFPS